MSTSNQGIQNYSKMNDKDKAYIVKLSAVLLGAIVSGIVTGLTYSRSGGVALIGFGIFFAITFGMAYFIKVRYDLSDMTDVQIVRHGIAIGLLSYIFVWAVIFNFVISSTIGFY